MSSPSPGLFSWGLPAVSSLIGFSVGVSFFSWVEPRRPRRPGEIRSAGEGSAPDREEMATFVRSFIPCLRATTSRHHPPQNHTHSVFGILGAEAGCLRGRSFPCHRHQTPPSRCPPSQPHLDLLKHSTGWVGDVSCCECVRACTVRWLVRVAHLGGHIQGTDSESARSSRHRPASLQSGWPQSGAARPTPEGGKKLCNASYQTCTTTHKTAECNRCYWSLKTETHCFL